MRTISVPKNPAPEKMKRARDADAYPCMICGIPVTKPKFECHLIDGGGIALHPDEHEYQTNGGDVGFYPVGTDCLRRFPEMKPFVIRAAQLAA